MPQAPAPDRKSSMRFKQVANINFAISHSERTELSEPTYLLPPEHRLPNIIVEGSFSEKEVEAIFKKQKSAMTGQAKARGSSPFWEGVAVLKNTDGEDQSKKLQAWKVAYEKATGHKVLHMAIHLDEGFVDSEGTPHYNAHAHVFVSRMNEKNRVIELGRKQLSEVQDLTAETLEIERGSTLKERDGKRGRKHIPHNIFREMANSHRLDLEKETNQTKFYGNLLYYKNEQDFINRAKIKEANKVIAEKDAEVARLKLEHKAEVEELKTEYGIDRAALKATGEATQRDYQQLKKDHEAKVAKLQEAHAEKVLDLENKIQAAAEEKTKTLDGKDAEIARLKSEYAAEREELKASGTAKQSDYQKLKKEHEATLAELTSSKAQAAKVTAQAARTAQDLATAQQEITAVKERYKHLRSQALAIQAERDALAEKVATLSVAPQAPTPAQARPTTPVPHPDTATAYVWPKLTEQQFQALPTRQFGDRVIAAARDVLVMCADLADAAAKHKLFPRQVVRALESLLENYREPPATEPTKPVPAQTPERGIQQPQRRSSIER